MRNLVRGLVLLLLLAGHAEAARNSSGTMSAVNGPYTPGTVISSAIINARFADIENELTDSLSRSAKGGMASALRGTDGAVGAPAFSWTNEAGSGLYRIGAGDFGFAVVGAKQLELTSSLFTVTPPANMVGNFSVNTSKFTVASATGNVASAGQIVVDSAGSNSGTIGSNAVLFGSTSAGEGIGSKRTATGNQFGLDFYTNSVNRIAIGNTGTVTVNTPLVATGGITIGAGAAITGSFRGTAALTPGSIAANTCNTVGTVTVTGAAQGAECITDHGGGTDNNFAYFCTFTSANTCTIRGCNVTTSSQTPPSLTYSCRSFNP